MAFHELLGAGEWPDLDLHNKIGAQLEAARQQEHSKAPAQAPAVDEALAATTGSLQAVFPSALNSK